jgi:RNA polymerase sigma-70 factor (ECF subfamily)
MTENEGAAKPLRRRVPGDEDIPLLDRTLGGDTEAFEDLVRRHECRVYRTVLAVTGNPEDAEEALQDTFLNVYQHLSEFRRDSRFTTWLTRIAINAALQKIRRRHESVSLDDPAVTEGEVLPQHLESWHKNPEQLYAAEEIRRMVEETILSLAPPYRVVFVLRDVAEMDTVEVAEVLDLTIAAVKSRLLRARLMMREAFSERFAHRPGLKSRLVRAGWMVRGMVASRLVRFPERKGTT